MKKIFFLAAMLVAGVAAQAQNIQVHYDFGRHIYEEEEEYRQTVTATFEQFSADKLGSWYYFIDLDFNQHGMAGAYTEVSREFNVGKKGFAAHIEYDGGIALSYVTYSKYNLEGFCFKPAALIGPAWNGHNEDFSTTYSIQLLYKYGFKQKYSKETGGIQLTGVWSTTFAKGKGTFSGFIDILKTKDFDDYVILTEPQLWYNINKKISIGTECEISDCFINYNDKSFFINPTIAVKFNL